MNLEMHKLLKIRIGILRFTGRTAGRERGCGAPFSCLQVPGGGAAKAESRGPRAETTPKPESRMPKLPADRALAGCRRSGR
jgi:hypothetical protein